MRIAFYAPMKPPTHPTPSGDRSFARLIMRALRHTGHEVVLASQFRSYDRDGTRQTALARRAEQARARTLERLRGAPPDIWFTYHLYHKAPDYLGPRLSAHFGVSYIVADASHAPKQAAGLWAAGFEAAKSAILAADRLVCFDPLDAECLSRDLKRGDRLTRLPPFTTRRAVVPLARDRARQRLGAALALPTDIPWAITVAMMRDDAKSASYRLLAECARQHRDRKWALLIAGDGVNRSRIETWFGNAGQVRFLGALTGRPLSELFAAGDFLVWPALQEGCAMALLEAAAAGLPVLAGGRPGLEQFVRDGETGYLSPEGDLDAFAQRLELLLTDPDHCRWLSANAAARARQQHGLEAAAHGLDRILRGLPMGRAA